MRTSLPALAIFVSCLWLAAPPSGLVRADGPATVTFVYTNTSAKAVYLAGDFNNWLDSQNGKIQPKPEWLMKYDSGAWSLTTPLTAGRHAYKFVVDDEWRIDPANPETTDDGFGGKNSVKVVAP